MADQDDTLNTEYPTPMDSPGFRFWQTFLSWQRRIDVVLAPYDLTQTSFSILAISAWLSDQNYRATEQRSVRQKVIVEMSKLNKMQVSQILQRLLNSGLVTVDPYDIDRRERLIELTEKGWNVLRKTISLIESTDRKFLSNVHIE